MVADINGNGMDKSSRRLGSWPLVFENDLRDGLLRGVRYRKCRILHAQLGGELARLSMKCHGGAPARQAQDFTIAPAHAVIPACAQGLHSRFFRGKAGGVALHAVCFGIAVAPFALRVDAPQKAIAKAFNRLPNARNLRDVDACANNHISPGYSSRSPLLG